jgi:hypothetical protein
MCFGALRTFSIYNFKQPSFCILAAQQRPRFALVPPLENNEGRRDAERRTLVTAAACFPDCRETEAHGNAFQRPAAAFFQTLVRASGDLAPGDFAPLACPRPASLSGRPLFKGRTETQGLPSPCLRGTSPGAASAFGLPLRPAFALPHFRTPHEAPLTGQDAIRISEVLGTGITIPQDLMLMNEKTST